MTDELKECPSVGDGLAHFVEYHNDGDFGWVECSCGWASKTVMVIGTHEARYCAAAKAWNTRPREDAQQARIAELEERTKDLSVLLDDPQSENALGAILLYIKRHFSPQKQESLARCLVADKYLETEARLAEYEAFHPRAMKLLHKRKNFLVVAEDEPYFFKVCNLIREHEKEINRWTDEDENWYQIERQKYLHRPLPQTQKGGEE